MLLSTVDGAMGVSVASVNVFDELSLNANAATDPTPIFVPTERFPPVEFIGVALVLGKAEPAPPMAFALSI
jgi:hypothetical protein